MTMTLPEENLVIPRDVLTSAIMHSVESNITFEDYLDLTDDESSFSGESSVEKRRVSNVLNRSQDILNILESIDTAYEEAKPERKKLGKLYSTMPILQPTRKRSIQKDGLGEMRNATFFRPPHTPEKRSPFDAILKGQSGPRSSRSKKDSAFNDMQQSGEKQLLRDFQRSNREETIRKAQAMLNNPMLGSARLTSKWDTSPTPPASNRRSSLRSRMMNQSMPILKPERKKSSEKLPVMRNETFSSKVPSSKPAASTLDAILQGNKPHVHRFSSLMTAGSKPIAPAPMRRAQSVLGTTSRTAAGSDYGFASLRGSPSLDALNDKWESSPPSSTQKATLGRSSLNQSMPILKPVRKKSSEKLSNIRNQRFRGPPPTASSKARFDAILLGKKTSSKKPSPFDAIVQSNEQQLLQQMGYHQKPRASPFDSIFQSQLQQHLDISTPLSRKRQQPQQYMDITPKTSNARIAPPSSNFLHRAQSVPHHVSSLDAKWGSSPGSKANNAVFQPLPKPVRRGSGDMKPMYQKLQGATKKPSPFDAIVQSSQQLASVQPSPQQVPLNARITPKLSSSKLPLPDSLKQQPQSSGLRRAQSVPAHVDAKWMASPRSSTNLNAVIESSSPLSKPVRRGSGDMKPMEYKLQGAKKKASPFDAIVQSSQQLASFPQSQAPLHVSVTPKPSSPKLALPESLKQKTQSSGLRRAQSVPAHVSDTKWMASPTSSTNLNAVFQSASPLPKPVRRGSGDMKPMEYKLQGGKKKASPFDAIVQSSQQLASLPQSRQQAQSSKLPLPDSLQHQPQSSGLRRAQSVPAHVSDTKWMASPTSSGNLNAVFQSASPLPKPVRRGSGDMKPMGKLQGATKKKASPFDAIVQSSEHQILQMGLYQIQEKQQHQQQQHLPMNMTPKLSSKSRQILDSLVKGKSQTTTSLRRAQSVPVQAGNAKWQPTSSSSKNAGFWSLDKPERKQSVDMLGDQKGGTSFETSAEDRLKRQQQQQPQYSELSKPRTTACGGSSLLEASALDMLLSKPMPRISPTRMLLQQRNQ